MDIYIQVSMFFLCALFASGGHCFLVVRKAIYLDVHVSPGISWNNLSQRETCSRNCIGVVIRLSRPTSDRYLLRFKLVD